MSSKKKDQKDKKLTKKEIEAIQLKEKNEAIQLEGVNRKYETLQDEYADEFSDWKENLDGCHCLWPRKKYKSRISINNIKI